MKIIADTWGQIKEDVLNNGLTFGMRLLYIILILIFGYFIIKFIKALTRKVLKRSKIETSIQTFLYSLTVVVLYSILIFVIGITAGIQATAFFTLFGALGIAVGLALQGSLANFAGGLLILIFKPFKIGDEIIIDNIHGIVKDINLLYTVIDDWRGEHFHLPNGKVSNTYIRNNSADEFRRVQLELHFPINGDHEKIKQVVIETMQKNPLTIPDRPYQFRIRGFTEDHFRVSARCWCKTEDYWTTLYGLGDELIDELKANGIDLAVPVREVRIKGDKNHFDD